MVDIRDVARLTGMSTSTVSRALRGLPNVSATTRATVESAAAQLNYVASSSASGLASGLHRSIAVITPSLDRWFFAAAIQGAEVEFRQRGYTVSIVGLGDATSERARDFDQRLLRKGADAILAFGLDFTPSERRELREITSPVVIVAGHMRGVTHIVGIDEGIAATTAMEHLLGLGHRRIAYLSGGSRVDINPYVDEHRMSAWRSCLDAAGIVPDERLLVPEGRFDTVTAYHKAMELLSRPDRPTAVFAGCDQMAFGVLLAARDLGIQVPDELSVIGIDDHDDASVWHLTTVRQDPRRQGATAARLILGALGEPGGEHTRAVWVKAPQSLVVRRTTAPPARAGSGSAA